jgi:hypothetical protein
LKTLCRLRSALIQVPAIGTQTSRLFSMITLTLDVASMGHTFLFLVVFFLTGVIISKGTESRYQYLGSGVFALVRTVVYFLACLYSLWLAADGHPDLSKALAIFAAFAFGYAAVRLPARL